MSSKTFKFDHHLLILDIFYNDKQIYKNAPILIEKLYILFILTVVYFLAFFAYNVLSIYHGKEDLSVTFIENIVILCDMYLMQKSYKLLNLIKRLNTKQSIVSDLLYVQILLISAYMIINGFLCYSVLNFSMDLAMLTTLIMFMTPLTQVLVSNFLKFFTFFMMEVWLVLYTMTHVEKDDLHEIMLIFLHVFIVINVLFVIIQQTVLVSNYIEKNERVDLSFETMHDLRNYVYSYIELNKMQEKERRNDNSRRESTLSQIVKITELKSKSGKANSVKFKNNKMKSSKSIPQEIDTTPISTCNDSKNDESVVKIVQSQSQQLNIVGYTPIRHKTNSYNSDIEDFTKSKQKINKFDSNQSHNPLESIALRMSAISHTNITTLNNKSKLGKFSTTSETYTNLDETLVMQSIEFKNKEEYYQQKFILYKICFLYHIELIFENMYNYNPVLLDVRDLVYNSCEKMKIIFMNKNNSIKVQLHSYISYIKIDESIFQYLLNEIIKIFHDQGYSDLIMKILFASKASSTKLVLKINIPEISTQSINEINNKYVIKKLIESLYSGSEFKYYWFPDGLYIDITLPLDYKEIMRDKKIMKSLKNKNKSKSKNGSSNESSNESYLDQTQLSNHSSSINNKSMHSTIYQFNSDNKLLYNESIQVKLKKENKGLANFSVPNELCEDVDKITEINAASKKMSENTEASKKMSQNSDRFKKISAQNLDETSLSLTKNDEIENKSPSINKLSSFNSLYQQTMARQNALAALLSNVEVTSVESKNNLIYVNVDDELNILKMNKRIFLKEDISLNTCTTISDFANFLLNVYLMSKDAEVKPSLLGVMDHMLDREYGYEAIDKARELNNLLDLDLTFILLSSTEDKETLEYYTSRGAIKTVSKPLNRGKLKPALQLFQSIKKKDQGVTGEYNLIKFDDIVQYTGKETTGEGFNSNYVKNNENVPKDNDLMEQNKYDRNCNNFNHEDKIISENKSDKKKMTFGYDKKDSLNNFDLVKNASKDVVNRVENKFYDIYKEAENSNTNQSLIKNKTHYDKKLPGTILINNDSNRFV